MTPFQQALMWAMQDLEECGIDPMTHLETTKALTRLYTSLTEEPHERTQHLVITD